MKVYILITHDGGGIVDCELLDAAPIFPIPPDMRVRVGNVNGGDSLDITETLATAAPEPQLYEVRDPSHGVFVVQALDEGQALRKVDEHIQKIDVHEFGWELDYEMASDSVCVVGPDHSVNTNIDYSVTVIV